ncbi:MAG: hypothetical protein GY757_40990 [bacterium]|nr:hypothetical protein [bacterium]
MRKKKIISFFILYSLLFMVSLAGETLRVRATGKSAPDVKPASKARALALRAATLNAYRKLAEKIGWTKVIKAEGREYSELRAFLKGTRIVSKKYSTNHQVEIEMELAVIPQSGKRTSYNREYSKKELVRLNKRIGKLEKSIDKMKVEVKALRKILKKLQKRKRK